MLGKRNYVTVEAAVKNLKGTIENIVERLFGNCEKKWIEAYFPFTQPSF